MRRLAFISNLRPARPIRRQAPAFTLVELVLVMTTMAILASIAVPRYANATRRFRADAAAQRILADLDLARRQAVATSSNYTFTVNNVSISYAIPQAAGFNHGDASYAVDLTNPPYEATALAASFAGGATAVTFNGFGLPDSGGSVVVQVGSEIRTVVLDADTGKAGLQ